MELTDLLQNYTDAIACLQQTLCEGSKSNNVDIYLMLSNIRHCEAIVQQLSISETDAFFLNALTSLSGSLSVHTNILMKKILQSNTKCISTTSEIHQNEKVKNGENNFDSNQMKNRQKIVESTIVTSRYVSFEDVIGLNEAKTTLQESVVMPLIFPHLFTGGRKPWKRILLYGPPGTGKSYLAQALSSEVNATFYSVSSSDLISSWVGESEKLIKELFHHANSHPGQSVIFMDEIDSLCRHRNAHEDESTRRVKTELLIQMDGANQNEKVFLLCATNCPWDLDTAFLRRFQKRIYIPLPNISSRIQLMKLHCKGIKLNISEEDWTQLAKMTQGYSGSDLATLTNGALFQPIRDLQTAKTWLRTSEGKWMPFHANSKNGISAKMTDFPPDLICPRDVLLSDFLYALQIHRSTVAQDELNKFRDFTFAFGQSG